MSLSALCACGAPSAGFALAEGGLLRDSCEWCYLLGLLRVWGERSTPSARAAVQDLLRDVVRGLGEHAASETPSRGESPSASEGGYSRRQSTWGEEDGGASATDIEEFFASRTAREEAAAASRGARPSGREGPLSARGRGARRRGSPTGRTRSRTPARGGASSRRTPAGRSSGSSFQEAGRAHAFVRQRRRR